MPAAAAADDGAPPSVLDATDDVPGTAPLRFEFLQSVVGDRVAQDVGVGTVGSRAQRLQLSGGIVGHRFMLA